MGLDGEDGHVEAAQFLRTEFAFNEQLEKSWERQDRYLDELEEIGSCLSSPMLTPWSPLTPLTPQSESETPDSSRALNPIALSEILDGIAASRLRAR